jgi:hypothetical protein
VKIKQKSRLMGTKRSLPVPRFTLRTWIQASEPSGYLKRTDFSNELSQRLRDMQPALPDAYLR